MVKNFGPAIVPGIAPAPGAKPIDRVKTVRPTNDEITEGIPQVIKQWRDTFGV
jgi:iron(III) transport system substrate-binding protein